MFHECIRKTDRGQGPNYVLSATERLETRVEVRRVMLNGYVTLPILSYVQTDATTPNNVGTCSASWELHNPYDFVNHV